MSIRQSQRRWVVALLTVRIFNNLTHTFYTTIVSITAMHTIRRVLAHEKLHFMMASTELSWRLFWQIIWRLTLHMRLVRADICLTIVFPLLGHSNLHLHDKFDRQSCSPSLMICITSIFTYIEALAVSNTRHFRLDNTLLNQVDVTPILPLSSLTINDGRCVRHSGPEC